MTTTWVLAAALFGSGFAALVYQVIWTRMLGLVFGVTVYAASTVLTAFMAGLGLGSYLAGRMADRSKVPLRWFAAAELVIGATALMTPLVFDALTPIYRQLSLVAGSLTILTVARFVCSAAVLVIPTIMMGATLPLALRSQVTRADDVSRRAAVLYAANTGGALCGALAAGYVLVTAVGMIWTLRLAALLNLAVAILIFLISGSAASASGTHTSVSLAAKPLLTAGSSVTEVQRFTVLSVFAISGFVSLALEVVWIRALLMFWPAETYVFTTILAMVLGGIAAGSAIAALWRGKPPSLSALALLEAAIGLTALLSLAALGWSYESGWRTRARLQGTALAILPASLLLGLAFPIGLHYWSQGTSNIGRRTGTFYAVNVAGSVAGALVAGFALVPALGTRGSVILLAGLTAIAGVWLDRVAASHLRNVRAALIAALFAGAALLVPDPLFAALARRYPAEDVLWRDFDAQSTVSVHRQSNGTRVLYLDGLHQANDSPGMLETHRVIGALAMALHPRPRHALVVGLGGGATSGAVASFEAGEVTVIELSPAVVRASAWFRHANRDVLSRPNVRLVTNDARNHLLLTSSTYDVITADIIQPVHAGAGNLYSVEYFRLVRRALNADGLMLQWVGQRAQSQYQLIVRTFLEVFPDATAWAGGTLLVGTRRPLRLDIDRYRRRLADPRFSDALAAAGIGGVDELLALYTAGPSELRRFVGVGPVLSDDRPLVEYFLSLPRNESDADLSALRGDVREVTR